MLSGIWLTLLSFILLELYQIEAIPRIQVLFPEDDFQQNTLNEPKLASISRKPPKHFASWNNPKDSDLEINEAKLKCADPEETFCEKIDEDLYPSAYVENKLKRTSKYYANYFNTIRSSSMPKLDEELSSRLDKSLSTKVEFCESKIHTIYPKIAKNIENSWNFVINQPKYHQAIRIELCSQSDEPCLFSNLFPMGYKTKCTQKYMKQPLLSLDGSGNLKEYLYRVPSHCQCDIFN